MFSTLKNHLTQDSSISWSNRPMANDYNFEGIF